MEIDRDYYVILDVLPTATEEEIRLAYRNLAKQYHPDVTRDPDAGEKLQEVQEAYETLSNLTRRKKYDHLLKQHHLDRSSALSLHAIPSHKQLVALPNEQAFYVLLSIMPTTDLTASRLPLNICLVIDRSTSMRGMRLQQVKEAIHRLIDKIHPEDFLSLVVFSDRAKVLLPSQHDIDLAMAKSVVSTIQPGGGTEILPGLMLGLEELKRNQTETSVNHLILLTDGQTYGDEQECLEQARWAGLNQIHLSTIGIGTDWNEDFLDQMADLSNGNSSYIDSLDKVNSIFSEVMHNLQTVVARELTAKINSSTGVRLHEAHQVTPHVSRLNIQADKIKLGSLSAHQEKSLLMEFHVPELPKGDWQLLRFTVEGDMPGQSSRPWEWVEMTAHVDEQPDPDAKIPSQITNSLNKLAIYKMQQKVATDLAEGQVHQATQRLETIATRLLDLGEPELARTALAEAGQIARTGILSAKGGKTIRYGTRALFSSKETRAFTTALIR